MLKGLPTVGFQNTACEKKGHKKGCEKGLYIKSCEERLQEMLRRMRALRKGREECVKRKAVKNEE